MNTQEYYLEAVRAWQQANRNLKHFAECCAKVSGAQTEALAADCKVSIDTIESYRRAYWLYEELMDKSERARIWEQANITLWVKAAQLRTRFDLSLEKTWDYLEIANDVHMTRESFAAHVDEKENNTPKWIRRLRQAIRFLAPSKNDYKSDMPPELQTRYEQAVTAFVSELQAIAGEGLETER